MLDYKSEVVLNTCMDLFIIFIIIVLFTSSFMRWLISAILYVFSVITTIGFGLGTLVSLFIAPPLVIVGIVGFVIMLAVTGIFGSWFGYEDAKTL